MHSTKKISRRIIKPFFGAYMYVFGSKIAARKIERLANDWGRNIGKLVDIVFSFEYRQKIRSSWVISLKPLQVKSEIAELCRIVQEANPKTIVEIGSASGGTLFLFTHVTCPERIISVDLPSGTFGGGYPFWKIPLFKSLAKKNVVQLIRADSHREETFGEITSLLKGKEVDFLFIDGDHTYQGVKQDFQMYSPLVRKGGIVAFHDIVTHDSASDCEVDKFWNEIKPSYHFVEIIENQNQKWAGIGILYL
jgi:predicted O-methyltransferase YrrM